MSMMDVDHGLAGSIANSLRGSEMKSLNHCLLYLRKVPPSSLVLQMSNLNPFPLAKVLTLLLLPRLDQMFATSSQLHGMPLGCHVSFMEKRCRWTIARHT
jgi:hypothetical protein